MRRWSKEEIGWLAENYPAKGKMACAISLNRSEAAVREKAASLGIRLKMSGYFFDDFQARAAKSKVGKKRPEQADVMRKNHREGKMGWTPERRVENGKRVAKLWEKNGHPRGMEGKHHSDDTKIKLSRLGVSRYESMSDRERYELLKKQLSARIIRGGINIRANVTWRGGWREIGGKKKYYRSRWEANYARYLEFMKNSKEIIDWSHEPKTFWFEGIKRGCITYLPDFMVITKQGKEEYHEVKGWMDKRSKTKIKRMAKYYPEVKLIVIDKDWFKSMRQYRSIIPGWE